MREQNFGDLVHLPTHVGSLADQGNRRCEVPYFRKHRPTGVADFLHTIYNVADFHSPHAENVVYKPGVGRSSPNLYVTIDCDGDRLGKTPVLKRNLAPKWDFKLPLFADSTSAILTLRLCHESSFRRDDKLGESSITLEKLLRLFAQIDVKKKATVVGKLKRRSSICNRTRKSWFPRNLLLVSPTFRTLR
ncbi:hypothetical protein K438DRAFT_1764717 [Mycena galopus ATCC 62051]|nr:hypothetical protein K438DRAFT_1764717 [Mycena galopus ATCC 62051]